MSHAIEQMGDTAAFFSARETPWHRLGTVTTDCLTAADAIKTAHLDWEVTKEPVTAMIAAPGAEQPCRDHELAYCAECNPAPGYLPIPGKYATVRTSPFTQLREVLGVVGEQYRPVQNWENADFLDALVGESGAHFETAGSLNGGRTVFVTLKAPKTMMIAGKDAVDLYLVATNSHDGSSAFKVAATPTRVVCANTLRVGLQGARATFSTRHTTNAMSRIDEAHKALQVMWNYGSIFEEEANRMAEAKLTDAKFAKIIDQLFPEPKDETPRSKRTREEFIGNAKFLYRDAPTQDGFKGTKWGAYNALTEWADWARPVKGHGDVATVRATRIAEGGWVDDFKQQAWNALAAI